MRVTLCRKPGAQGAKLSDDIYGDLDPTSGDGWFDPTMIMIHADPECSESPEGDILLFDSVNKKLSLWVERHEFYAQFDGEWRMAMLAVEAKEEDPRPRNLAADWIARQRLDRAVAGLVVEEEEDRLGDCCVNPACDGIYEEMSLHDDWEGRVTCNRCGDRPLRWRR